jgi:hypothetical protein
VIGGQEMMNDLTTRDTPLSVIGWVALKDKINEPFVSLPILVFELVASLS